MLAMTRPSGARGRIAAAVWSVMMLVWLAALLFGAWWVWPHFARLALTSELIMSTMWLVAGFAAWLLALSVGLQRYGRRSSSGSGRRPS
jgi:hypothetical protein